MSPMFLDSSLEEPSLEKVPLSYVELEEDVHTPLSRQTSSGERRGRAAQWERAGRGIFTCHHPPSSPPRASSLQAPLETGVGPPPAGRAEAGTVSA